MKKLYARLAQAGFARSYVRKVVLPDWWDDEAASTDAGLAEAMLAVSRHTGLDYASLRGTDEPPKTADTSGVRFKRSESTSEDDLRLSASVALRCAQLGALGVRERRLALPLGAQALRSEILASGAKWVSLDALLDASWDAGVPVLHLSQFPPRAKKMDGMVAMVGDRPVIVIARQDKPTAWLAFILAHELGHVVCGHVGDAQTLVDLKVSRPEDDEVGDGEESEANAFAIELLCGAHGTRFVAEARWPNATALATAAIRVANQHAIDPGHVVLNFGHTMDLFALARAALKLVEPGADAPRLIRTKMIERLDWSALPPDSARFLMSVAGEATDAEP